MTQTTTDSKPALIIGGPAQRLCVDHFCPCRPKKRARALLRWGSERQTREYIIVGEEVD
jgi:hypothetical protein